MCLVQVAKLIERWTCNLKVTGSNSKLEAKIHVILSALCANPVFWKRHKTEALIQLPYDSDSGSEGICHRMQLFSVVGLIIHLKIIHLN